MAVQTGCLVNALALIGGRFLLFDTGLVWACGNLAKVF
jgi:hypothetical protein